MNKRSRLPNPLDTVNDPVLKMLRGGPAALPVTSDIQEPGTTVGRALLPVAPPSPTRSGNSVGLTALRPGFDPNQAPAARETAGDLVAEIEKLKAQLTNQLATLRQDALLLEWLDPKQIRATKFRNRGERSLLESDPKFVELRDTIKADGQQEPIRVRPLDPPEGEFLFEIVSGHRRHRVALVLERTVLARIDRQVGTAQALAIKMNLENEKRLDVYPIEKACWLKLLLDESVFTNAKEMGEVLGYSKQNISRYLQLANLPPQVLECFSDPRQISLRWADDLHAASKRSLEEGCALAHRMQTELTAAMAGPASAEDGSARQTPLLAKRRRTKKFVEKGSLTGSGKKAPVKFAVGKDDLQFKRHNLSAEATTEFFDAVRKFAIAWLEERELPSDPGSSQ